ncbi:hypothetical protein BH11BAC3_BH11BAC3_09500 [soil metagenome]
MTGSNNFEDFKNNKMDNNPGTFESLYEDAGNYVDTKIELLKLKMVDKTTDFTSSLIARICIIVAIMFAIVIFSIGLSLWLGELVGTAYLGFFIVAAIYGLLAVLLQVFKKSWIKEPLSSVIIKKMLN